jgi:hypothetical protein
LRLLAELKRRNVIRMAGLYLVGAWLLIQIAETLLPIFDTPGWVLKVLVVLLAIGLLPALVFSWVYELTPDGLKRDAEVDPARSIAPNCSIRSGASRTRCSPPRSWSSSTRFSASAGSGSMTPQFSWIAETWSRPHWTRWLR